MVSKNLQYAGYTQVTTVELEPLADATVQLGIWNLLQLPQPGAMLIPTLTPIQPQLLFGTLTASDLTVAPSLVCWNMTTSGETTKIALKARR